MSTLFKRESPIVPEFKPRTLTPDCAQSTPLQQQGKSCKSCSESNDSVHSSIPGEASQVKSQGILFRPLEGVTKGMNMVT